MISIRSVNFFHHATMTIRSASKTSADVDAILVLFKRESLSRGILQDTAVDTDRWH